MASSRKRMGKWKVPVLFFAALIAAGILLALASQVKRTAVIMPAAVQGPLSNPMTGFAPNADDYEAVGENTLVYVDVTWRELEPVRGEFDFASVESSNHLEQWRAMGKHVVFRFLCDEPGDAKHMDIPDWLYEQTEADGDWYDTQYGRGYSPNYENPAFIQYHRLAIQALGERFGKDDFFFCIELGSLGHWGEWHTKYEDNIARLPLENVRDQYIEPYAAYFPNAVLLMRRPFRAAKELGMGLFNDMTGEPESTQEWLDWIARGGDYSETGEENALLPMPDAWKSSPIGGEFTSSISMDTMLGAQLSQTVRLIRDSHMTFIGPKCPVTDEDGAQLTEGIQAVLSALGSRLRISRAVVQQPLLFSGDISVQLDWVNDGSAPFYKDWAPVLLLLDRNGEEALRQQVDIDIRSVTDAQAVSSNTVLDAAALPSGAYSLALAVIDPGTGTPALTFAMEGMQPDHICILGVWTK